MALQRGAIYSMRIREARSRYTDGGDKALKSLELAARKQPVNGTLLVRLEVILKEALRKIGPDRFLRMTPAICRQAFCNEAQIRTMFLAKTRSLGTPQIRSAASSSNHSLSVIGMMPSSSAGKSPYRNGSNFSLPAWAVSSRLDETIPSHHATS